MLWEDPRYLKAEIVEIGEHEMVARVDDFLRRRTSLSLTEYGNELDDRITEISALLGITPEPSVSPATDRAVSTCLA